jgi:hypothetical protein
MDTIERVTKPAKSPKVKKAKPGEGLAPTTESGRIRLLKDMLETNRTAAEGWRQVAEQRQMKIDDQALMLDQQALQIETLRRRLDEANALQKQTT